MGLIAWGGNEYGRILTDLDSRRRLISQVLRRRGAALKPDVVIRRRDWVRLRWWVEDRLC